MLMESPLHISEGEERRMVGSIIHHMFSHTHGSESQWAEVSIPGPYFIARMQFKVIFIHFLQDSYLVLSFSKNKQISKRLSPGVHENLSSSFKETCKLMKAFYLLPPNVKISDKNVFFMTLNRTDDRLKLIQKFKRKFPTHFKKSIMYEVE